MAIRPRLRERAPPDDARGPVDRDQERRSVAVGVRHRRLDEAGTDDRDADAVGGKTEKLVKVELTYKFNMGFTAVNSLRAAEQTHSATDSRYGDARDQVEEQVRNAWEALQTAKSNADALRNQANIAAEFLELARKERALGTRSLIDVLSGETSLINASSDAAAAETDIAIAVFRLLSAMGRLQVEAIR